MNTLDIELQLSQQYKYKPLPPDLSNTYRELYKSNIPKGLKIEGDVKKELYTKDGTLICTGYRRIVVGDYGAFIEFDKSQANEIEFMIAPGKEYRVNDPRYKNNVKYIWMTARDESGIKIYFQKKGVTYADYQPGMYYISPHECLLKRPSHTSQGSWCSEGGCYCNVGPFSTMSDYCDSCLSDDDIY